MIGKNNGNARSDSVKTVSGILFMMIIIMTCFSGTGRCGSGTDNMFDGHRYNSFPFEFGFHTIGFEKYQKGYVLRNGMRSGLRSNSGYEASGACFSTISRLISKFGSISRYERPERTDTEVAMGHRLNSRVNILWGLKRIRFGEKGQGSPSYTGPVIGAEIRYPFQLTGLTKPWCINFGASVFSLVDLENVDWKNRNDGCAAQLGITCPLSRWIVTLGYQYQVMGSGSNKDKGRTVKVFGKQETHSGPVINFEYTL